MARGTEDLLRRSKNASKTLAGWDLCHGIFHILQQSFVFLKTRSRARGRRLHMVRVS